MACDYREETLAVMRILLACALATGLWLALSGRTRLRVAEWARDLSDVLMLAMLRSSSGFARDVSLDVRREERARRLRWR